MKFQAILPNRDFIMNFSLLLARALGEALQNAFPHRACHGKQQGCLGEKARPNGYPPSACRPKMHSWLGEEPLLYAFPPSGCPPQIRCKALPKFGARHFHTPLVRDIQSYWVGVGCVSTLF